MSTQISPTVRSSKRKRTAVSYIETGLIDDVPSSDEKEGQEIEAVNADDDGVFGKRQKVGRFIMGQLAKAPILA